MSYQPINVDEMRDKLMSVTTLKEKLEPTEHLAEYEFQTVADEANHVTFEFPNGWQEEIKDKSVDPMTISSATVNLNGHEFSLTKGAALKATSLIGLEQAYVLNTPGELIAPQVNWHYQHGGNKKKDMKLLASNDNGIAFVRGSIHPFSNVELIDAVLEGIQDKYGTDDVLVDYKFNHDLDKTNMRLVVPTRSHNVTSARTEQAGNDPWSVGIEIKNSVTGQSSLELSGYLFAWWCTNGCTFNHVASGKYRRKPSLSPQDAYEWARYSVDEVLGDLEHEFDSIDSLTQVPLEGELNDTLGNMFERFRIPVETRQTVMANLVESDDLSAYGLMNAITAAANDEEMSPAAVGSLLNAGGQVAHVMGERCEVCHRF